MYHAIKNIIRISILTSAALLMMIGLFAAPAPAAAYVDMGTTISIPSIEVEAPIVRIGIRAFPNGDVSWDTTRLTRQVGFLEGMSWFGEGGNIVLGGHSELTNRTPAVFYRLNEVAVGDEIIVTQGDTTWRYTVIQLREVGVRDLSILYPTNSERLTIMTCDINSFTGSAYSRRTVIIAQRASN